MLVAPGLARFCRVAALGIGGWVGWCSVRARRGGLGVGWVVLPPSTLTVGVLRRFFEGALTRGLSGFVIES